MPNPLKRVAEADTFDFGKAVTLVISRAKELSKTVNGLVDQIEYLQGRKKQEEQSLERIVEEKKQTLKLKQELIDKITEKKTEFLEFVGSKQREIEVKETALLNSQNNFTNYREEMTQKLKAKENELDLRSTELEKQKTSYREEVRQEMRQDIATIEAQKKSQDILGTELAEHQAKIEATNLKLAEDQNNLADSHDLLNSRVAKIDQKEHELMAREKNIKESEQKVSDARLGVGQTVADLENQISLIKRERDKNQSDLQAIENMRISLDKRSKELDNREIHIGDREATANAR